MKIIKRQITLVGFLEALSAGRGYLSAAAAILVELVDKDPTIYNKIIQADPTLSFKLLQSLERLGRGEIIEPLLFDTSPGAKRLLTMPASVQKACWDNQVPVAVVENGKEVVVRKPVTQLTPQEARVVFSEQGLRTPQEQLHECRRNSAARRAAPAQRYEIMADGYLVVHLAETVFTVPQMEDIFERMKVRALEGLRGKK